MIDLALPVRTKYFTSLSGNVVYGGITLEVHDSFADNDSVVPYIVLTEQTVTPGIEGRCRFVQNVVQGLEIVTGFPIGNPNERAGGRKQSEEIANIVYPLIGMSKNSADWPDFGSGFKTLETELDFSNYITETQIINGGYYFIYRKAIRIRHIISQQ